MALLSQISGLNSLPIFDASKPKGHEFPEINIDRLLTLGFQTSFIPETGLENVYRWYPVKWTNSVRQVDGEDN